ncbi:MAG: SDR family oxidoreductase, partial [Fibrobacter sp.]|nr:SDR family oxidoreductase [Fibrobacter sp.]
QQPYQPGRQEPMNPHPASEMATYQGSGKLAGKVAIVTGGDSGIGRAVAIGFAKEGADIAIIYLEETKDAIDTRNLVENTGRICKTFAGDVSDESFCKRTVDEISSYYRKIDILVNNAGEQHVTESIEQIESEQIIRTFKTNIFSMFYMVKAVLTYMSEGSTIINTASITAYEGNPYLLDYSSTKGAIVAFTRSLSLQLVKKGIRVNGVAPGPIWTPLIPSTFSQQNIESFGQNTPMQRAGDPDEVAPCYIFLASKDSSYMSGQILHPNGGKIVNG